MDGYGNDATEAFAEFMNSMRGGGGGDIEGAWKALEYWLFIVRTAPPDLSDPRVQAAAGAPRWTAHGPGSPPEPGLYLRRSRRGPNGENFAWLGALIRCAGDCCPPDASEGWGWLYGPLPYPPGWCAALPDDRQLQLERRGGSPMMMYDCPACGRERIVCWDGRARRFLCGARGCGFSAPPPPGQCACGSSRDHVAVLLSTARAEATKLWVASAGSAPAPP